MTEETSGAKTWVKFDEDADTGPEAVTNANATAHSEQIAAATTSITSSEPSPAVLTLSPPVALPTPPVISSPAVITSESVSITIPRSKAASPEPSQTRQKVSAPMKSVALHVNRNGTPLNPVGTNIGNAVIRQGFANGEVIVTLLPVNTQWPWITPAKFRPELVPEELMAQGLTLTVEDYVHVMELLTNDVRFNLYNVCYKRILVVWIFSAFIVLLGLLFSGVTGLTLFGLGVMWLILNAAAIFLCMWLKIKLNHGLEKCLGQVNKHLIKHKIILGLDDRGKISCHKVNLCFIYFDSADCIKKLQDVIDREDRENGGLGATDAEAAARQRTQFQHRMDIDDSDIIIQGANSARVSRKQVRGERVLLRYLQRWSKDLLRRRLDWTIDEAGGNPVDPRHLTSALCPCQYVEEYLRNKPNKDRRAFCPCCTNWLKERGRWVKLFVRRLLELNVDSLARTNGANWPPRHCATGRCPCQFIDYHLKYKPRGRMPILPSAPR